MRIKEQYITYKERQKIRRETVKKFFQGYHYVFIKEYILKNRKKIFILLSLLILQIIIEISVLILADGYLRGKAYMAFQRGYLSWLSVLVLLGVLIYLLISFFALKIERQIVINFVNTIRRIWYILFLNSPERSITNEKKADFIAKVSYHFPLVSLGIDNSAIGSVRSILFICILIAVGSFGGSGILLISLGLVLLSIVIGTIAYLIANYYISQEVASYSRVIKNINNGLSEISSIKLLKQEYSSLKELDLRVNIDTFFRIRRDIWLRYFNKVLYATVFFVSFVIIIFGIYQPEIFSRFYNGQNIFILSILSLYSLRLFYEAGRTGLYIPPLRLGLLLSIPEIIPSNLNPNFRINWETLEFRSNKTKIHPESMYFKNIKIVLNKGKRYLFTGGPYSGKTSLAELFAGKMNFNRNGWLIKIDNHRFDYAKWVRRDVGSYYISPNFHSDKTLGELIFGKSKPEITEKDLSLVYEVASENIILSKVISKKRFMGESFKNFDSNGELKFAVHILHCLICRPNLVIIDNQWLDLNYVENNELIKLLNQRLNQSTIVIFSRNNNDIISYDNKYEIQKNKIETL